MSAESGNLKEKSGYLKWIMINVVNYLQLTRKLDMKVFIYEDNGVDFAEHELELTYLLPKRNPVKENLDIPPVKVRNDT